MATLNLTPEEFADIALLFLSDKAINPDEIVTGNEHFNDFMKRNAQQIKNKLLKYYLDADPIMRRDYKLIKDVFRGGNGLQTIKIGPSKIVKPIRQEKSLAKKLIKGIVSKILKKESLESEEIDLLLEILEEDNNG